MFSSKLNNNLIYELPYDNTVGYYKEKKKNI